MNLKEIIKNYPDYPKKGVNFKDIWPLFRDQNALEHIINIYKNEFKEVDYFAGIEARGFTFASILAFELKKGFIPIRKKGKLPGKTIEAEYELEYGKAEIEIQTDVLEKGSKIVIMDDLLATGGTARAAASLIEELGAEVISFGFLVELAFLKGRDKLKGYDIISIVTYE
jgi:adenine phosphoribosyltransferase|tara:strand:- start:496 stop:1005 length:510 start_codon:yes stop_codon:yes gene_type:complete